MTGSGPWRPSRRRVSCRPGGRPTRCRRRGREAVGAPHPFRSWTRLVASPRPSGTPSTRTWVQRLRPFVVRELGDAAEGNLKIAREAAAIATGMVVAALFNGRSAAGSGAARGQPVCPEPLREDRRGLLPPERMGVVEGPPRRDVGGDRDGHRGCRRGEGEDEGEQGEDHGWSALVLARRPERRVQGGIRQCRMDRGEDLLLGHRQPRPDPPRTLDLPRTTRRPRSPPRARRPSGRTTRPTSSRSASPSRSSSGSTPSSRTTSSSSTWRSSSATR